MPTALFDADWYRATYADVAALGLDPWTHYRQVGAAEGRDPHPLFSGSAYLRSYPDVAGSGANPLLHYLEFGQAEGRSPYPLFEPLWYVEQYPEVLVSGLDPLSHFWSEGAAKGYDPGPDFDTLWYSNQNSDEISAGVNPLKHYVTVGQREGRQARPPRPTAGFLLHGPNEAALSATKKMITDYADTEFGIANLRNTPLSSIPFMEEIAPALARGWRQLYLSLTHLPQTLLLVSSTDEGGPKPHLQHILRAAAVAGDLGSLLVLETDAEQACIGLGLPEGAVWRSLSDLQTNLTQEQRVDVVTALIHNLRPRSVMIMDSKAGWASIASRGAAMCRYSGLFATFLNTSKITAANGSIRETGLGLRYMRRCLPYLSAVISDDSTDVECFAFMNALDQTVKDKIRLLDATDSGAAWNDILGSIQFFSRRTESRL